MADGWEIERRYHVRTGPSSVRIREGEPRGPVLTIKSGQGVKRREAEVVVDSDVAEALFRLSGPRVIEKVRFHLGPWELDRFLGSLEGLSLLEIELDEVDQPLPEAPPDVLILREVTDDNRFTSSYLSCLSVKGAEVFVRDVYGEVER